MEVDCDVGQSGSKARTFFLGGRDFLSESPGGKEMPIAENTATLLLGLFS